MHVIAQGFEISYESDACLQWERKSQRDSIPETGVVEPLLLLCCADVIRLGMVALDKKPTL